MMTMRSMLSLLCLFHVVNGEIEGMDQINDEFCDCADGSDEPGTSACSYTNIEFYCRNEQYFAKSIPTSLIGDGICDCCDGSDENKGFCENLCLQQLEDQRNQAKERLKQVQTGANIRETRLGEVNARVKEITDKVEVWDVEKAQIRTLRAKVLRFKAYEEKRELAMQIASAEKKKQPQQCDEATGTCSAPATEEDFDEDYAAESDKSQGLENQPVRLSDKSTVPLSVYFDQTLGKVERAESPDILELRRSKFLGPIFNGGEEGPKRAALAILSVLGFVLLPIRCIWEIVSYFGLSLDISMSWSIWFRQIFNGKLYRAYRILQWVFVALWDGPVTVYYYFFPLRDPTLIHSEAESLRNILRSLDEEIEQIETKQKDELSKLESDYGPNRVFLSIQDECVEQAFDKYKYQLCFFKDMRQDGTVIGKWNGWNNTAYDRMYYDNGQKCWNGPKRSADISLSCGAETAILQVDEVATCVYAVHVATPLLCTPQLVQEATTELEKWTSV